jgi:acetyl esterase/lipase
MATLLVRAVIKHWPADDAAMVRRARRVFGGPRLGNFGEKRGMKIEKVEAEVRGEWLTPAPLNLPEAVLLYFHGGGFISCSPQGHRPITATLARLIGCRVFSVDYRLAPEHPFPAAVEDTVAAFQWLLKTGVKPKNIVLAGDSAGGNLVVSTLVSLREKGIALPACVACIAPVVDLTGDFNYTNQQSCAMFFPEDGRTFARIYLNGASPLSPLASPLFADLKGMPPMLIQVADKEFLFDDAVRLNEKAIASGVDSRLHVYPGLPHVWQMFVGLVPEARQALQEIADFVKQKLGAAGH